MSLPDPSGGLVVGTIDDVAVDVMDPAFSIVIED